MDRIIKFSAVGDCFITRPIPQHEKSFEELSKLFRETDVRLANLEVCLHDGGVYPSAESGGTWAVAHPKVLETLRAYNFNLISWANNHTLDYLHDGLLSTKHHLDNYGFLHAGAGENLSEASMPRYLEHQNGRVALISCATTAPPYWIAGEQRKDCLGRPGLNLIRLNHIYSVTNEDKDYLTDLAKRLNLNVDSELSIEFGFQPPLEPGVFKFGNHIFITGGEHGDRITPSLTDYDRIIASINNAKENADYVLVSIHAHEMKGRFFEEPADFLEDLAHQFIENGADAIVGHGPHVIRGIEIYQGKPIFYSLGNFIYQPDTVSGQPADSYEKFGLDCTHDVYDVLNAMSANYTRGHYTLPAMWEAIVPVWQMVDGELVDITLHPIDLGFGSPVYRMGTPALNENKTILQRMRTLSQRFGTEVEIKDGKGIVRI